MSNDGFENIRSMIETEKTNIEETLAWVSANRGPTQEVLRIIIPIFKAHLDIINLLVEELDRREG